MDKDVKYLKVKKMIDEHWLYVRGVLKRHEGEEDLIKTIEFHYKTAFLHGYKHGVEEDDV